jgi:hypothetical protein
MMLKMYSEVKRPAQSEMAITKVGGFLGANTIVNYSLLLCNTSLDFAAPPDAFRCNGPSMRAMLPACKLASSKRGEYSSASSTVKPVLLSRRLAKARPAS